LCLFSKAYYLIGLNDIQEEGNWVWIGSKTQASYINWRPTEPNNGVDENCVVIDGTVGQWNDTPCHLAYNYICEKDSVYVYSFNFMSFLQSNLENVYKFLERKLYLLIYF
jgi:hypothetical protein